MEPEPLSPIERLRALDAAIFAQFDEVRRLRRELGNAIGEQERLRDARKILASAIAKVEQLDDVIEKLAAVTGGYTEVEQNAPEVYRLCRRIIDEVRASEKLP